MSGKFIVIEGMDGAGTTTQSALLASFLRKNGASVLESAEPTKSAIGKNIRELLAQPIADNHKLLACLALLFAADRMQHINDVLLPALKSHQFVVVDRYVLSSIVYQGLHFPTDFVKEINRYALKPDLTIVLDVEADKALSRLKKRVTTNDFYESIEFLKKIRERYLAFAKNGENMVLIDGGCDEQEVRKSIYSIIEGKFLK